MQRLWWIATALALVAVYVSGQSLGRNYGINIRLSQRGLDYAGQRAMNDLYNRYRNYPVPDFRGSGYKVWNVRIPSLSRPTFRPQIIRNNGVLAPINIASIRVTGHFQAWKRIIFKIKKSGTFTIDARQISLSATLGAGRDGTGRPTVIVRSCTSSIGSLNLNIRASGIIGWIIGMFEGRIGRRIKSQLAPLLCDQVRKLVTEKLNPRLRQMRVTTRLQDSRLQLDYSLLRAPIFASNYIDTTIRGDVIWKGRRTNTPSALRSWPAVPGSTTRMATIYLTNYVMNAIGVLMHRDGSLSYHVSRDRVSSSIRPWLSLSCSGSACAGSIFPELARQYPDGWLEARLQTNAPPRLSIGTNVLTGSFSGTLQLYVKRPNGASTRVATATASLQIPLTLRISNNVLRASVGNPRISVTPGQANTNGLRRFLSMLQQGFTSLRLNEIGQRGWQLPSYRGVRFIRPSIYIRSGIIAISTDVIYYG